MIKKVPFIFQPHIIKHSLMYLFSRKEVINVQNYKDEQDYYEHQKQKTNDPDRQEKWLNEEWGVKLNGFKEVFEKHKDIISESSNALCLGARTGQEVQALVDLGVDALGVDLVAFPPLVEEGDVHNLRFSDNSYDLVFSNIFDHVLHPDKFISEIERILKKGGHLILHVGTGAGIDEYSVQIIKDPNSLKELFKKSEVKSVTPIQNSFDSLNYEILSQKV